MESERRGVPPPAQIQVTAARNTLDQVQEQYPRLSVVITGMLRLYTGIFHYPVPVNVFGLARKLQLKKDDLETMLLQLHAMNLIEFKPAHSGPMIHVHHYRVPSRDLIIDHKRIARLRENEKFRTESMTAFLQNRDTCVNRMLLAYFDETAPEWCGHCYICAKRSAPQEPKVSLEQRIVQLLETHESLSLQELLQAINPSDTTATIECIRQMTESGLIITDGLGNITLPGRS
ncbi:MAG: RecQ family zinc-binding domain-containing protein [Chitinophagaceae bacterium]